MSRQKQKTLDGYWFLVIIMLLLAVSMAGTLFGCSSLPAVSTTPPAPKYELTLGGNIDGAPAFTGIAVGSAATSHNITITSPIAVDYFTVESCHRDLQMNGVIKVPWYDWSSDNKSFTWSYVEAPTIEDTGDCILRFCAFSKVVGSPPAACAVVDFKSLRYALPSTNICNGASGGATGTAMCHTRTGLLERVQFAAPVLIAPQVTDPTGKNAPYWITNQCVGKFIDSANTLFEYQVPSDECTIVFMELAKPHRKAKLTVIPYNTTIYQGGN